jgi:hypothetical protein
MMSKTAMTFVDYLDEERYLALKAAESKAYVEWLDADYNVRVMESPESHCKVFLTVL